MTTTFNYGRGHLTSSIALAIANGTTRGVITAQTAQIVLQSQQHVQDIVSSGKTVYGINTGFGALASTLISESDTRLLQYKILQSHSVGVGNPVSPEISKLMLITKVHSLAKGFSGVQLSTLERIIWHIDNDENLTPIQLGPKEGLALINGTQFILSFAVKAVQRLHNCLDAADIIGAMSLEALTGTQAPFNPKLHELRPFAGNQLVAQRLRLILKDSEIMQSHIDCGRVQDPYSLRCMPQVHGASRNAWQHLKELTEIELNSVTDNPVIFSADDTISGGNFHGQPLALPLDYAAVAASEAGNISDRRCYLLLEGKWGLPMLLMNNVGLNSGFMIPQYTTAALVTENKTLCFPASADSIPTSLGQEDHVSMGSISGRKLSRIIDNLENILGIELLTACQAIEFRRPLKSSALLE
ncbi:MAG: histidine ammonia-lyase, partial [Chitinophagaceae bacterium]